MAEGWFEIAGRSGDRTLQQQMLGLAPLLKQVTGKRVLDIGCAEGLISMEVAAAGAASVEGVEIINDHVGIANSLRGLLPCAFFQGDANVFEPSKHYDVVLLLSVLHKLWNPSEACKRIVAYCDELCVIRLPPAGAPVIRDHRTHFRPFDIGAVMEAEGFKIESSEWNGPFGEWTGFYRRV